MIKYADFVRMQKTADEDDVPKEYEKYIAPEDVEEPAFYGTSKYLLRRISNKHKNDLLADSPYVADKGFFDNFEPMYSADEYDMWIGKDRRNDKWTTFYADEREQGGAYSKTLARLLKSIYTKKGLEWFDRVLLDRNRLSE